MACTLGAAAINRAWTGIVDNIETGAQRKDSYAPFFGACHTHKTPTHAIATVGVGVVGAGGGDVVEGVMMTAAGEIKRTLVVAVVEVVAVAAVAAVAVVVVVVVVVGAAVMSTTTATVEVATGEEAEVDDRKTRKRYEAEAGGTGGPHTKQAGTTGSSRIQPK